MFTILFILLCQNAISDNYNYNRSGQYNNKTPNNKSLQLSEICFYSKAKNKCPGNIQESNTFGPGEYSSELLSFSKHSVKIHIVEPIYLFKPLIFSAPVDFSLVGCQVNGEIEVTESTSINVEDATATKIKIYWSVKSKKIPKINTLLPAKSVFIQIIDLNEELSPYKLPFYFGQKTYVTLSITIYNNIQYSVKYNDNYYYVYTKQSKSASNKSLTTLLDDVSGTFGSLQYSFIQQDFELIISGTGKMNDFASSTSKPWQSLTDQIYSVTIEEGVTSIGNYAFSDCPYISLISIPNSVITIGKDSFSNCHSLSIISLPENVESLGDRLFYNCTSLVRIYIPQKVTHIPDYSFYNCCRLITVEFHQKVTSIGEFSFYNCTSLNNLTFSKEIKTIPKYSFSHCDSLENFELFDNVTSIGDFAFYGCNGFKSIKISEKVTFIGFASFSNLTRLRLFEIDSNNEYYEFNSNCIILKESSALNQYIRYYDENSNFCSIPENVISIQSYAFYYQNKLVSIEIPEGVTEIDDYAFYNCSSLSFLVIPNSVISIKNYAFYNCTSIKNLTLSNKLESIGDYSFYGCIYINMISLPSSLKTIGESPFSECKSVQKIEIESDKFNTPDQLVLCENDKFLFYSPYNQKDEYEIQEGITKICKFAFHNCNFLRILTIPESVSIIDDYAFYQNEKMFRLNMNSNKITYIGNYAFYSCYTLETFNIPDSVEYIGDHAFQYCSALYDPKLPENLKYIGEYAFANCFRLNNIAWPNSITTIKKSTFEGCRSLTYVDLPEKLTTIETRAFLQCIYMLSFTINGNNKYFRSENGILYSYDKKRLLFYPPLLRNFEIENTVTTIDDYACGFSLAENVVLPSNIKILNEGAFYNSEVSEIEANLEYVGTYVFANCYNLGTIKISGLKNMNDGMFSCCSGLRRLELENSDFTRIGNHAFEFCDLVTNIYLPDEIEYIGDYAFYGCQRLRDISVESVKSAKYIGDFAFYLCDKLVLEYLETTAQRIGDYAFARINVQRFYAKASSIGIGAFQYSQLTSFSLTGNITHIGHEIFYECEKITSIYFSNDITSASNYMCYNCINLKKIDLREKVNYIGTCAFTNCKQLSYVYIGSDVALFDSLCFANCSLLENFTYGGKNEPIYSIDSFLNCKKLSVVTVTSKYTKRTFCGFLIFKQINESDFDETPDVLEPPPPHRPIYIDINQSLIIDDSYYFDINESSTLPGDREILCLKFDKNIHKIRNLYVANNFPNRVAVELSDDYEEFNIFSMKASYKYDYITVITKRDYINLTFGEKVTPKFTNQSKKVEINVINLTEEYFEIDTINPGENQAFTLVINNSPVRINLTNFDKNNSKLIIENSQFYEVVTRYVIVQQFVNAELSAGIINRLHFGIGASIIVTKDVSFAHCVVYIPFNKHRKTFNYSYIQGKIKDYPARISIVTSSIENVYITEDEEPKKVLIAQSNDKFFCNPWINRIDDIDRYIFSYVCNKEIGDDNNDTFSFYGIEYKSYNSDANKKKKKISPELLAAIIVSVIAGVVIIASIIIYFVFVKRKIESMSEMP